jgi:hypothetical protein
MPKAPTAEELAAKEKRLKERADMLAKRHATAVKKAAHASAQLRERQRFAEAHIKYALGGCLLKMIEGEPLPENFVRVIIQRAEAGIQPAGTGRDAWENLKQEWRKRFISAVS